MIDVRRNKDDAKSSLLTHLAIEGFKLTEGLDRWSHCKIVGQAFPNPTLSDDILASTQNSERAWLRIGLLADGQGMYRDWEPVIITVAKGAGPSIRTGQTIELELTDTLFQLQNQRTAVWKGPVSQMPVKVATELGLTCLAEKSKGEFQLYQSFQTDFEFITRRALIRAVNEKGSGGYHFWARDGKMIFGTPAFAGYQPKTYDILLGGNNVISTDYIEMRDASKLHAVYGGAGIKVNQANPLKRATGPVASDPKLAQSLGSWVGASVVFNDNQVRKHTGDNPLSEQEYIAQANFALQRQQYYAVVFTLKQQPLIRVGDYVKIPDDVSIGEWSGLYWVTKLVHSCVSGEMTTLVTACRGELNKNANSGVTPIFDENGSVIDTRVGSLLPSTTPTVPLGIPSPPASATAPPPVSGGVSVPINIPGTDPLPEGDGGSGNNSLFATPQR